MAPATAASNDESLDLSEWCNHRVLARQEDIYVSGIIKSVDPSNTILVEFDYPEGTQQSYYDVFSRGRFDIISDASPSAGDITIGTRVVCIRSHSNRSGNVFIEAVITQILNDTKQFVVHTVASNETKTVKRAHVRLLRPPWWDELTDTDPQMSGDGVNAAGVITTQFNSIHSRDMSIYSNTMAGAVAAAASNNLNASGNNNGRQSKFTRIDHILPTVQVNLTF